MSHIVYRNTCQYNLYYTLPTRGNLDDQDMRIRTLHRGHSIDELEQTLPHMREESGGPTSWEFIGKPNSKPSLIWGCYCV